jgi:hypothetical protein
VAATLAEQFRAVKLGLAFIIHRRSARRVIDARSCVARSREREERNQIFANRCGALFTVKT